MEFFSQNSGILILSCIGLLLAAAVVLLILYFRALKEVRETDLDQIDGLTNIGSRKYIRMCYEKKIDLASRTSYYCALFGFDVDTVRNLLGSHVTDELLRYAATTIKNAAGDYDYVARVENGMFAFLFRCNEASLAGKKVVNIVDGLNRYETQLIHESRLDFRVGYYGLKATVESFDTVYSYAKLAYTRAVESNLPVCACNDSLIRSDLSRDRLRDKLQHALDTKQFELYVQLIYNVHEKKFTGGEALCRWNNPIEGLQMPAYFIKDMYAVGLIDKFDYYMIDKACQVLEKWSKTGYGNLHLSCNVTRVTISSPEFVSKVRAILKKYSFDSSRLTFEITEDALCNKQDLAFKNVKACKALGIQISLDDFGAGSTSFHDLCDYPVDIIKMDRSITVKSDSERGDALLRGMVDMAHQLFVKVLCEGVEDENQSERVIADGCDYIQGYHYSYAYPVDQAIELYEKQKSGKLA